VIEPSFTLLQDFGQQYGVVQYDDASFGACNVGHFNPAGNSDPNRPFTGITQPYNAGSPAQEGHLIAWADKANNLLGRTFLLQDEAIEKLHEVLGGISKLGVDVFALENNPFKDQFTKSDFPNGYET
jgi:hypothetical protein